jgi:hypothetical protein
MPDNVNQYPCAQSNGHDAPELVDELVPRITAAIEEGLVGGEDPVAEPVVAHELPVVLDPLKREPVRARGR